jgi:AcrR family transcriptional regulator
MWDLDAVLAAAGEVFHHKGFEATSMRDLEEATGLRTGSVYAAFGSKDGLFAAALGWYRSQVVEARVRHHLDESTDPRAGIRSLFTSTFEGRPHPDPGCMVTNSAIESPLLDDSARVLIGGSLDVIREGFTGACRRVVGADGAAAEVPAVADVAEQLLALYQGLLVMVRFGLEPRALRSVVDAVDVLLDNLERSG